MAKGRIAMNDAVEIVDRNSPDYGKKGIVTVIKPITVTMKALASKWWTSHEEFIFTIKIDGVEKQFKKNQIKKAD